MIEFVKGDICLVKKLPVYGRITYLSTEGNVICFSPVLEVDENNVIWFYSIPEEQV